MMGYKDKAIRTLPKTDNRVRVTLGITESQLKVLRHLSAEANCSVTAYLRFMVYDHTNREAIRMEAEKAKRAGVVTQPLTLATQTKTGKRVKTNLSPGSHVAAAPDKLGTDAAPPAAKRGKLTRR